MLTASEATLIERAKAGDRGAFAELYGPVERPLAAFLYRLVAARQDAEDLAQETAVRALETISQYAGASSFRTWLFSLAADAALDHLRGQDRWDPDAQLHAAHKTGADAAVDRQLRKLHKSGLHTTYEIRGHIDFCFTCMGRCLPPHEQAALLLIEIHGFTVQEAAETLGVSPQAIEFRLEQARQALIEHYDERCALINKNGACGQCAGLHTFFYKDRRDTEQALFQINLQPQPTASERAATLNERLAIVRSIDPLHSEGTKLYDFLMDVTREANGYR